MGQRDLERERPWRGSLFAEFRVCLNIFLRNYYPSLAYLERDDILLKHAALSLYQMSSRIKQHVNLPSTFCESQFLVLAGLILTNSRYPEGTYLLLQVCVDTWRKLRHKDTTRS